MSDAARRPHANQGAPEPRYDGRAKVTGAALFASDHSVTRPADAWLVLSRVARGRIIGFGERAARAVPGVLTIVTHRNRPPLASAVPFAKGGGALYGSPPLSGPDIAHAGQIVAVVVAESYEAAREGGHVLRVSVIRASAAHGFDAPGAEIVSRAQATRQEDPRKDDAAAAYAAALHKVDGRWSTPAQHHNPIELFTTTARWDGDMLTVWQPSQSVHVLRGGLAQQLGVPVDRIRVVSPCVGGGFGSKVAVGHSTALIAAIARQLDRPIKLVATREQGFSIAGYRQENRHRLRLGADVRGRFTAYIHDMDEVTDRTDGYNNSGIEAVACMYGFGTVGGTARLVRADRQPPVFMRCPGELPPMFAFESAIDELAEKMGADPVRLRQLNDTRVNPVNGAPFTSRSLNQSYDEAAKAFGWFRRTAQPGSMRDGDRLIGWGCATATYPTQVMPALVRLTVTPDGAVRVETASHDIGTGACTVIQQAAAEGLSAELDRVTVVMGDSALPPGAIAGGSVGTASAVSAIMDGCAKIASRLGIPGPITRSARESAFKSTGLGPIEVLGEFIPDSAKSKTTAGLFPGLGGYLRRREGADHPVCIRRRVCRGPGSRPHSRDSRAPHGRRFRSRPHHEHPNRAQPAYGRHDLGRFLGAARGDRC